MWNVELVGFADYIIMNYSIFIPVGHRNFFPSVDDLRFHFSILLGANQLCITTAKMAAIDREKGYVEH